MSGMATWCGILGAAFALANPGCGGDDGPAGDRPDAGVCGGALGMAWPSGMEPAYCAFPWDGSKPAAELTECGEVFESCSTAGPTPELSCLDEPPGTPPAGPATVSITGFVDVFSSGPDADRARIQVFRESDLAGVEDLAAATPLATFDVVLDETTLAEARACPKEKEFMQGQCVIPTDDCPACAKALDAVDFCFATVCEDLQRWEVRYRIDGVPTNEFLVVRSVGLDGDGNPQVLNNTWSPLLQHNVYLSTADPECAGEDEIDCFDTSGATPLYRMDVNLLSSSDYFTIPTSAGLSSGITPGNGAIAGEVHDCDGLRIRHAQVGFTATRTPRVLVYFNGNPVKTLPRLQQINEGTNLLSLYSGLDIAPGPIGIVALGVRDGAVRELGSFSARVWPDSVTLIRLGGGRPPQP